MDRQYIRLTQPRVGWRSSNRQLGTLVSALVLRHSRAPGPFDDVDPCPAMPCCFAPWHSLIKLETAGAAARLSVTPQEGGSYGGCDARRLNTTHTFIYPILSSPPAASLHLVCPCALHLDALASCPYICLLIEARSSISLSAASHLVVQAGTLSNVPRRGKPPRIANIATQQPPNMKSSTLLTGSFAAAAVAQSGIFSIPEGTNLGTPIIISTPLTNPLRTSTASTTDTGHASIPEGTGSPTVSIPDGTMSIPEGTSKGTISQSQASSTPTATGSASTTGGSTLVPTTSGPSGTGTGSPTTTGGQTTSASTAGAVANQAAGAVAAAGFFAALLV